MKVVITEAALADMLAIGRFIMQDSPIRAESFVSELFESCQLLETMPRAHPLLPGREDRGIRRKVHGKYLIFFRIGGAVIDVVHVLHGAQEYERILFGE
jgi:toxin ParE1/3/4